MIKDYDNIDFNFLFYSESSGKDIITEPYVPTDDEGTPLGKSGITIGHGCDLGQQDESIFEGTSQDAYDKLYWAIGLIGDEAFDELKDAETDLEIEISDAKTMTANAYRTILTQTSNRLRVPHGLEFAELPNAVATITADIAIQYGAAGMEHDCPSFWQYLTTLDFFNMFMELWNFGDSYTTRRRREAKLLWDSPLIDSDAKELLLINLEIEEKDIDEYA